MFSDTRVGLIAIFTEEIDLIFLLRKSMDSKKEERDEVLPDGSRE